MKKLILCILCLLVCSVCAAAAPAKKRAKCKSHVVSSFVAPAGLCADVPIIYAQDAFGKPRRRGNARRASSLMADK